MIEIYKKLPKTNCRKCGSGHYFIGTGLVLGCFLLFLSCAPTESSANQGIGVPSPAEWVTGEPWEGETGISEAVGEIMQRERARQLIRGPETHRIIPFRTLPDRKDSPQNPDSPESSSWPVSSVPLSIQSSLSSLGPFTPQTIGPVNFTGATLADTGAFPPDSMGAVGPTQYIVAVNGRIRSFNKITGSADGALNVDTDVFFASVMTPSASNCQNTNPPTCTFTSDPRIRYDRLSGRWFITMIDVPGGLGTLPNRIMIAVSSGSTITNISNFTFFQFEHDLVGTTPNADTNMFADYDTLGIDANALYIGVNIFKTSGNFGFSNTTGFVVRKSSILTGSLVVTPFRSLIGADGPFTPQGVDNYDPTATQGHFIGVSAANFGELILRRVNNPATTPSISSNVSITVSTTSFPLTVPHLGNTGGTKGNLDALDDRLFAAHLRNGSLWTAHNIAVDDTGVGRSSGDRDGSRWYEITNLSTTPAVVQSGTVFDTTATNPRFYWIPSTMVSGQGHAALGFSTAGTLEHANAATVGRLANDALGTTETPLLYTNTTTAYNPPGDPGGTSGRRWGDYSYTSLDPDDDMTMWTIQEFCNATNSYGVQVVKLIAPPPATPVSVSPSTVSAGLQSVDIVVTGSSVSGSGFFDPDPGPAFPIWSPTRISALIGGVTVKSVTFTDPIHLTVNISTVGSFMGMGAVTVTNPDGQSSISAAPILTVNGPCPAISVSPATVPNAPYNTFYTQKFTASGGTSPFTFGLTGSVPTGFTFLTDTLSGTPLQVGSFSFTVTATDSFGCSGSQGYVLTVIDATASQIPTNPGVFFETIQSAYDNAINGDTIQLQAIDFVETLLFDNPNSLNPFSITLSGGYDSSFDIPPASFTSIMGSLTIAKGTVIIENIILH